MYGTRTLAAVVGILALSACSSAQAAEVIGEAVPGEPTCGQTGEYTVIQITSPGNKYAAPFDGVITSWRNEGAFDSPTFKVARLGTGSSYTVIASDGPRTLVNRTVPETYPVRIPVRQGDVIGAYVPFRFHSCIYQTGNPADLWGRDDDADLPAGGTGNFEATGNAQVPLEATIERDRDADGYGDETQDECPTNAATQGPCPLPATLGQTITPYSGPSVDCGTSTRVVTNSPGYPSAASQDGVITSWSYQGAASVGTGTVRVKMLRPLGASSYRVIGADEPRSPAPNVLNTFAVRIPVRQGDRVGLGINGSIPCAQFNAPGNYQQVNQDLAVGSEAIFYDSNGKLDISAVLEADADNDGFGDTSQDQCPTDASTQGPCPVVGPPDPGPDDACEKARKKLAKAKAKLKTLKQKDAAAKKVKQAKKKVKKAKAAVKRAC